jgi:hypothetical protein
MIFQLDLSPEKICGTFWLASVYNVVSLLVVKLSCAEVNEADSNAY